MRAYEYIIRNTGGGGGQSAVAGHQKTEQPQGQKSQAAPSFKSLQQSIVAKEVVQIVKSEVNYMVSTVELRTGSQELQQEADLTMRFVNMGLNTATAATAGLLMGGPIGAIGAAAISVVTQAINTVQSISQAQRTIETQQALENITIYNNMLRAGSRGSRQNNE